MPSSPISQAFGRDADLGKRVSAAIVKTPELRGLFHDIASYITRLQRPLSETPTKSAQEPALKKRKLEVESNGITQWDKGTYSSFNDISFSIPQRKKLRLDLGSSSKQGIRAMSAAGDEEISTHWAEVQDIFCLPVPEKAQAQYNFCVFSHNKKGSNAEQILWTVPGAPPKEPTEATGVSAGNTYTSTIIPLINTALKPYKKSVIEPNEKEFSSQIVQAHRKGEKAYHVKAFRGAKDGFLFLLSTGIIWGFKKPLQFFSFDSIDSVSYTSVLQRTFNLNITARATPAEADTEPQEFEFSMVDQADFAGIDAYVKRHRLEDASMAEERRARKLNVNGVRAQWGDDDGGEDGEGELQKAQREAEDLEDEGSEEDENFDPGSEGESEGEVSSSSDEDGLGNGGNGGNGGGGGKGDEDEEMDSEDDDGDE